MSQFRKKPVVIEAVQFTGLNFGEVFDFLSDVAGKHSQDGAIYIPTLEGTMRADKGDWVIRGVQGEFYPCKPAIFEATYEPVPSDS